MRCETVRLDERRAWYLLTACVVFLARRSWRKNRAVLVKSALGLAASLLLGSPAVVWASAAVKSGVKRVQTAAMKVFNPRDLQTPGP
jgi:hypothetical protein